MPDAYAAGWGLSQASSNGFCNSTSIWPSTSLPAPTQRGTAPPSLFFGSHPRRCLGYRRARGGRPLFLERLHAIHPFRLSNGSGRATVRHGEYQPLRGTKRKRPLARFIHPLRPAPAGGRGPGRGRPRPPAGASPRLAPDTLAARWPPLRRGHAPAPNASLTSGRQCSATVLSACPATLQATARPSTLPARSQNRATPRPHRTMRRQTADNSLQLRCSVGKCGSHLCVWAFAICPQTAALGIRQPDPDSVRFRPLHSNSLRSRTRTRRPSAGCSVAFRSAT